MVRRRTSDTSWTTYAEARRKTLERLRDILWPPGDPDRQWSADTICEIADELVAAGYGPKNKEVRDGSDSESA